MLKSGLAYEDEPMDKSEILYDFEEEGEIQSSDDEEKVHLDGKKAEERTVKGDPIFERFLVNEAEELKRLQRAKRFALPVEQNKVVPVSPENISHLYKSLGIDKGNEKQYRFNAVHMRGTQDMSTEDVFQYFITFNPSAVEWINDISCNVIWMDDTSAAKALLNLSKEIKNLDKVHFNADPFEKDSKESVEEMECSFSDAVDAREIECAIPPGHWRVGVPYEKSTTILLRLATRSDKKQKNAERNSEYYKRYGNPHFGNIPGLVSNSMRSEVFKKYRNYHHNNNEIENRNDRKNPWGGLAEEWSRLDKPAEDVRFKILLKRQKPILKEDLRLSINSKHRKRLKREKESDYESSQSEDDDHYKGKFPKMKMYADEEEKMETNSVRNKLNVQVKMPVMEDLRLKIDRRKRKKEMLDQKWRNKRHWNKFNNTEEDDDDDDDEEEEEEHDNDAGGNCHYVEDDDDEDEDDERGSSWALEQYSDLRESLEQNKKYRNLKYTRTVEKSDSEDKDDVSDEIYDGDFSQRSPLRIEIENDEYFDNESNTI